MWVYRPLLSKCDEYSTLVQYRCSQSTQNPDFFVQRHRKKFQIYFNFKLDSNLGSVFINLEIKGLKLVSVFMSIDEHLKMFNDMNKFLKTATLTEGSLTKFIFCRLLPGSSNENYYLRIIIYYLINCVLVYN